MDITKLYFVLLCIVSYYLCWIAEKYNKKILMMISGTMLILYSGLRGINVGIDTQFYYAYFIRIKNGIMVYFNERAFLEIIRLLFRIFDDPAAIIFIISTVTIALFYISFWKLRDRFSVSWMVLIFICFYYARSMNIIRQYLAWAIVFYAITFLLNREFLKFSALVGIAMCFHLSAIASFAILGIYILTEKQIKNNYRVAFLILVTIGSLFLGNIFSSLEKAYGIYYNLSFAHIGFLSIYKLLLVLTIVFLKKHNITISLGTQTSGSEHSSKMHYDRIIVFIYIVGILFDSLSYFSSYISRVGLYFLSFELLFWGQLLKTRYKTGIYKFCLLFMLLYMCLSNVIFDGYGLFPYTTIFD